MKLPNVGEAQIDREKITGYLLSTLHPDGAGKAAFFSSFGFRADDWAAFARALQQHALRHDVLSVIESPYGKRYVVEGDLETPGGRSPTVRTVWIIDKGSTNPRLITAYPIEVP